MTPIVQGISLGAALLGLWLCYLNAKRYPRFRWLAFACAVWLAHAALFYLVLIVDRLLVPWALLPDYVDWSAALRFHGLVNAAFCAFLLWRGQWTK